MKPYDAVLAAFDKFENKILATLDTKFDAMGKMPDGFDWRQEEMRE